MKNIQKILFVVVMLLAGTSAFAQLLKTTVTVTQIPKALTVTATTPICPATDGTVVIAAAQLGVTYNVYAAGTTFPGNTSASTTPLVSKLAEGSSVDGSGNLTITIPKANLSTGDNTFVIGGENTCFKSLVGTTLIKVAPADATVTPATNTINYGTNGTLAITNYDAAATYKVYVGGTLVTASIDASGNITIPAANLGNGINNISVEATNGTGCTDTKTATITVKPTATITGTICEGVASDVTVTVTGEGPWDVVLTGGISVHIDKPTAAPFSPVSKVVSVTVSSGPITITSVSDKNTTGTMSGSLVVNPKSTVAITADQVVCANGTVASNIEVTLTGAYSNGSGWSFEYKKIETDPTNGNKATTTEKPISGTTNKLTIPTGTFSKTTEYELTKVTDANGCPVTNKE